MRITKKKATYTVELEFKIIILLYEDLDLKNQLLNLLTTIGRIYHCSF